MRTRSWLRPEAVFLVLALAVGPAAAQEWEMAPKLVAVGDVHGDYGQLITVLRDAGVVDAQDKWIFGKGQLVQTGDRIDRGPDSRKIMDFFMRLEKEARKAGGAVFSLVGNHEVMNVMGDLRYVIPEEFAAFKGPDSKRLQDALLERIAEERKNQGKPEMTAAEQEKWRAEQPLGFVEHRQAWSPKGTYGSWIAKQDAVIRIGDTLFMHGGLGPKYGDLSLKELDDRIRDEIKQGDPQLALVANDPDGPLWFRGLAQGDPALADSLTAILKRHGAKRMVIGHTPTEGLIFPRYGGRVIQIDVGLSKAYGGPPAGLLIENGKAIAIHRGRRIPLPEGDGEGVLRYVRDVAAGPDAGRLAPLVGRLEQALSGAKVEPQPAPQ